MYNHLGKYKLALWEVERGAARNREPGPVQGLRVKRLGKGLRVAAELGMVQKIVITLGSAPERCKELEPE